MKQTTLIAAVHNFFVWAWLSELLSTTAFGKRFDLNVQDLNNDILEDTANHTVTEVSIKQMLAIAGHTSLDTLKFFSLQSNSDGDCDNAIKKVRDFAAEQLSRAAERTTSLDVAADETFLGDSGSKGERELFEAYSVLDQTDLRDAMKVGEVWTLDDQDELIKCETGQSVRIEEGSQTQQGARLLQGDMLVPANGRSLLQIEALIAEGARWNRETTWPTAVTMIAYCFLPTMHRKGKQAFEAAVKHTSIQVPCIEFRNVGYDEVSKSCKSIPSILVQDSDPFGCWSVVGLETTTYASQGRSQPLNLGKPCWTLGVAAHELGHALGMFHEQSRIDRDNFVIVHWENIPQQARHNFEEHDSGVNSIPYDPLSLMHYSPEAWAADPSKPTLTARNPKANRLLGARIGWSEMDVRELGLVYCPHVAGSMLAIKPMVEQKRILDRLVGHWRPYSQLFLKGSRTAQGQDNCVPASCSKHIQKESKQLITTDDIKLKDDWGDHCDSMTMNYELRTLQVSCSMSNKCRTDVSISCPGTRDYVLKKGKEASTNIQKTIPFVFCTKVLFGKRRFERLFSPKDDTDRCNFWVKEYKEQLSLYGYEGVSVNGHQSQSYEDFQLIYRGKEWTTSMFSLIGEGICGYYEEMDTAEATDGFLKGEHALEKKK